MGNHTDAATTEGPAPSIAENHTDAATTEGPAPSIAADPAESAGTMTAQTEVVPTATGSTPATSTASTATGPDTASDAAGGAERQATPGRQITPTTDPVASAAVTVALAPPAPVNAPISATGGFTRFGTGVRYVNDTGAEIIVFTMMDGDVVASQTVGPGDSADLPFCAGASSECSFGASVSGRPYSDDLEAGISIDVTGQPWTGRVETTVEGVSPGFADGFTGDRTSPAYTNSSTSAVTVHVTTGIGSTSHEVLPGSTVVLPGCEGDCTYDVLEGFDGPHVSSTFVTADGVENQFSTGYGSVIVKTAEGLSYTNTSSETMVVGYSFAGDISAQVTVRPGSTVVVPACPTTVTECQYLFGPVIGSVDNSTAFVVTNQFLEDIDPTQPTDPGSEPVPNVPGQPAAGPARSGRSSTGSSRPTTDRTRPGAPSISVENQRPNRRPALPSDNSNGWAVPIDQLDICGNIGGLANLTRSGSVSNVALLCPATKFGYQLGNGDIGGAFSTAWGMGWGQVSSVLKTQGPVGYLSSVAIDTWTYTISEATKTDFSRQSVSNTVAYAVANPRVVAQETVKAVGVVAANLWAAFLPW